MWVPIGVNVSTSWEDEYSFVGTAQGVKYSCGTGRTTSNYTQVGRIVPIMLMLRNCRVSRHQGRLPILICITRRAGWLALLDGLDYISTCAVSLFISGSRRIHVFSISYLVRMHKIVEIRYSYVQPPIHLPSFLSTFCIQTQHNTQRPVQVNAETRSPHRKSPTMPASPCHLPPSNTQAATVLE